MEGSETSLSQHERYQLDLFYLTKGMRELTADPEQVCLNGAVANIPWETRTDIMGGIDAVSSSPLCDLPQPDGGDLLQFRGLLASLPPAAWNTRIDTVEHCIRIFGTPEWSDVRAACARLLPAMTQACARAGVAEFL